MQDEEFQGQGDRIQESRKGIMNDGSKKATWGRVEKRELKKIFEKAMWKPIFVEAP